MKKFWLIPMAAAVIAVCGGCGSDKPETVILCPYANAVAALHDVNLALVQKFCEYDTEMNYVSYRLAREGLTGVDSQRLADSLQRIDGRVRLAGILDLSGKRLYNSPTDYFQASGEAPVIRDAPAAMRRIKSGEKFLSGTYLNKRNELVADYICPVKNRDDLVSGAVYIQIAVTELCRHFVTRSIADMPVNIWVMQTDGLIVYDTDPLEINQNILTGNYFLEYPTLIQLAGKIASSENGTGQYSYMSKGNKTILIKSAQWNSFTAGGRQWRIVMNIEDRSFIR